MTRLMVTSFARRWWLIVSLIVVFAAVATVLGLRYSREHRTTGWVVLHSGSYQGVGYQFDASLDDGRLCLELFGTVSPKDTSAGYAGQCEFDTRWATSAYWGSGEGPGNSTAAFGPLPTNATQIKVATHEVLQTFLFPKRDYLPAGRYWLDLTSPSWPAPADGAALDVPQPLNAHGQPVNFTRF